MSEWQDIELGDFLTFQRGFDIVKRDMQEDGLYDVIFSSGFGGKHNEFKVKAPGVVVGRKGTLGSVFYSKTDFWPTDTTLWIKDFHGNNPKFAYYFLSTLKFEQYDCGSANPTLNRNHIHTLEIRVPKSLQEQENIADILSSLDRSISNLRRQNETLEAIAQTLFKHWFIDFEFPNADGKPYKSSGGKMERSELGEIPAGWRVGKLGDEFDITMGQSPAGSSYNEEGKGLIFFQGRTDFGFRFPQVRLFTTEPKRIANKFDVLVSVRAPVGDINVSFERCCIGRGLSAVSSKYKSYCLYKLKSYRKFFDVFESEGTIFGSLNKQNFNDLESVIPYDELVENFEFTIAPLDQKIFVNERQIQTLTQTRDVLLPKLMSGQLRVTDRGKLL